MRGFVKRVLAALGTIAALCVSGAHGMEAVAFDTLTLAAAFSRVAPPISDGQATRISGWLKLPPGKAPFPAVVITHGCSGAMMNMDRWAEDLRREGIASLIVDSFSGRGVASTCHGGGFVHPASLLVDAYRARHLLAKDPRIDGTRIAILGFSTGGRTALLAGSPRFRELYGDAAGFSAHIAFYPSCASRLADEHQLRGTLIRVFHGAEDDVAPIGPCRDLVRRLTQAGADAKLVELAGAGHGFDAAGAGRRWVATLLNHGRCSFVERDGVLADAHDVPATTENACVTRGGTVAYHRAAHERAADELRSLLRRVLGPARRSEGESRGTPQ